MAAHQAPPSLGFSRQEHWSGLPFPSPMHESEKWKWSRSVMSDSVTPWTEAYQAPPSMGFSRQEYWSGLHCLLWPISICLFKYRSWFCVFNTIIVTSIALKISQELPCPKLQISNQVPSLANGHQLRNISGLRSALPLSFLSHIKLPFSWSIPCLYLLLSCVDLSLLPPIHGQLKLGPSFWVWPVSPLELCFWWLSPGLHTLHPVD